MNRLIQNEGRAQGFAAYSGYVSDRLYELLLNLLVELNAHLDRRLVETFLGLVMVILVHRHRNQRLLLSELGGYLLHPEQAPAGTKRLSNLLRSPKWTSQLMEGFLWQQADQRIRELDEQQETALAIWDESVIEKAESLELEGLCAVRSTDDAWRIVLAYARRWLFEMAIRFDKCELAFECPRLRTWEHQFKFLLIVSLAHAFLLSLLSPDVVVRVDWLLRHWCHRTGKWRQEVLTPLYRLRTAVSNLWLSHPPPFCFTLD